MGTKKHDRERARKRQADLEAKHEARQAAHNRRVRVWSAIVGAVVIIGLAVWAVIALTSDSSSSDTNGADASASDGADAGPGSDAEAATDAEATPGTELTFSSGWGTSPEPPDPSLAEGREWTVTMSTNQGDIVLSLDGVNAPQATASFVALAEDDFFDQTECHRLVTAGIYVLQCGDPSATGTGGPAYSYGPIENAPADDLYPAGTLAMARVGGDGESMGSQFFIVYEDSTIPSDTAGGYTVFGQVTEGLSIVEDVASAGTLTGQSDGPPAQSVIVNEVSVE
ncbi:peptidylprolyl isomerase [Demequina globuliformis]|uniref:peptidylprolyl isomerase n=1 Tax=Demequina globuliformis TaxID=676202 RepID=UPI0007845741|nr:peptidylprolyl isomerase [Demequina globuliformis]